MRRVPRRSGWLQMLVVLGGFLSGPLCAISLSAALTPESTLVQALAPFGFAAVFAGGTVLWTGLGVATVVVRGIWNLLRGRRPTPSSDAHAELLVPPGYRAFPVLGAIMGLGIGVLAGFATDVGVAAGVAAWLGLGLVYGLALWVAAHHGYFPFPELE